MDKQHSKKAIVTDSIQRRLRAGKKQIHLMIITLLCSGLLLSCAQTRKETYPDDYVYLEPGQVISKMTLLSSYMRNIDEILLEDSTTSSEQQARIEDILVSMNDTLDSFVTGNVQTSHLVIDDHMDQFKSDLNLALFNVRADPPNYFALGRLSGSCAACHQYRSY
jgi:hypothetical protein